eukprot:gb/GEZN01001914.1/.p1 GENE.gb/GEZN01001914.1/~~gb/GEZN01001914.1/.p1  ORF type:complete len:712 (+),score=146.10 gb/GEZN01001914.1/:41-2176(+)
MGGGGDLSEEPVAAGITVFTLDYLDDKYATVLLVIFIIFTMSLERALEMLEHRLQRQESAYLAMLGKLYKELMILGLLSFVLILVLSTTSLYTDYILIFEFVHLWIFFVALLFVMHAFVFMTEAHGFAAVWYQVSFISLSTLRNTYEAQFSSVRGGWYRFKSRNELFLGNIPVVNEMEFHHLRVWFLTKNKLPRNFDFPLYLKLCLSNFVSEHLDAKDSSWIILMIILVGNVGVTIMWEKDGPDSYYDPNPNTNRDNSLQWMMIGWILFFVAYFLAAEARRIKHALLRLSGIPNDDVASLAEALEKDETLDMAIPYYLPNKSKSDSIGWGMHDSDDDEEDEVLASLPDSPLNNAHTASDSHHAGSPHHAHHTGHGGGKQHNIFQTLGSHHGSKVKIDKEVRNLFRCSRPGIYVGAFDLLMLLQCFYLGYFVLRNIWQSYQVWYKEPGIYIIYLAASLLPQAVVMTKFAPSIIKHFVLVSNLANINENVMLKVKQNMDEMHFLANELGEKLQLKLQERMQVPKLDTDELKAEAEEELKKIFKSLDKNGDGQIQLEADSFRKSLRKFKLKVTKRQAGKIIRVLDIDRSGGVDVQEFIDFVFGRLGNRDALHRMKTHAKKGVTGNTPDNKDEQDQDEVVELVHVQTTPAKGGGDRIRDPSLSVAEGPTPVGRGGDTYAKDTIIVLGTEARHGLVHRETEKALLSVERIEQNRGQ